MRTYQLVESPFLAHDGDRSIGEAPYVELSAILRPTERRAVRGLTLKGHELSIELTLFGPGQSRIARAYDTVFLPFDSSISDDFPLSGTYTTTLTRQQLDDPRSLASRLLTQSPKLGPVADDMLQVAEDTTTIIGRQSKRALTISRRPHQGDPAVAVKQIYRMVSNLGGAIASPLALRCSSDLGSACALVNVDFNADRGENQEYVHPAVFSVVFDHEEQYQAFVRALVKAGFTLQ